MRARVASDTPKRFQPTPHAPRSFPIQMAIVHKPDGTLLPLPPIPAKRYFTIGEVSELCGVKPHVLRYWEQEFTQLKPVKRRGNRRYYQHHEVLLIRRIRELLYEQGFTISGARNKLDARMESIAPDTRGDGTAPRTTGPSPAVIAPNNLRKELTDIAKLLSA